MRMGIMQPYFFPYPGHFSLIALCDEWVVFDISQYTPKTWMNRNQVLHPNGGPNWIGVPLANGSTSITTAQARLLDPQAARRSALGKLSHYRRRAPFHAAVETLVDDVFKLGNGDDSLTRLNVRGLDAVCRYVGIPFNYRICSELHLDLPQDLGAGDWAPEICSRLGANEYLNPISGQALFDRARFDQLGIQLQFLRTDPLQYSQGNFESTRNLSILDALMWNPPDVVRAGLLGSAFVVPAGVAAAGDAISCARTASSES